MLVGPPESRREQWCRRCLASHVGDAVIMESHLRVVRGHRVGHDLRPVVAPSHSGIPLCTPAQPVQAEDAEDDSMITHMGSSVDTTLRPVRRHLKASAPSQRARLGGRVEREGGGGEGVALAVAQLPLLRAPRQDVVDVLRRRLDTRKPLLGYSFLMPQAGPQVIPSCGQEQLSQAGTFTSKVKATQCALVTRTACPSNIVALILSMRSSHLSFKVCPCILLQKSVTGRKEGTRGRQFSNKASPSACAASSGAATHAQPNRCLSRRKAHADISCRK